MEVFLIFPKSKQAQQELGQELAKFQSEQALKMSRNCPAPRSRSWNWWTPP